MKMAVTVIAILIIGLGLCNLLNPDLIMQSPLLKSYFAHFTPEFVQKMRYFYRAAGAVAIFVGIWFLRLK